MYWATSSFNQTICTKVPGIIILQQRLKQSKKKKKISHKKKKRKINSYSSSISILCVRSRERTTIRYILLSCIGFIHSLRQNASPSSWLSSDDLHQNHVVRYSTVHRHRNLLYAPLPPHPLHFWSRDFFFHVCPFRLRNTFVYAARRSDLGGETKKFFAFAV